MENYEYKIKKEKDMKTSGKIFISKELLKDVDKTAIEQVKNVAKLPGIIGESLAMPDIHSGYGFPIGGVAAFDLKKGIISPGGVGYDINCGVRLLTTNIPIKDFLRKRKEILHDIKRTIPSGVGRGGEKYSQETIKEILAKGSKWALENKFATKEDLECTEENGCVDNTNPDIISKRAIARGTPQIGTLGAGNHFIDILRIEKIFEKNIGKKFGLDKNNIIILIHCGSRGLGHQIASDYIQKMEKEYGITKFPDRELIYAPLNSKLGKEYFSAMNCAVNFAFCNRQMITYSIRQIFKKYFGNSKIKLMYDISHNIAKIEEHNINGKKKKVCVHRKGATRCFGPGRKEIPKKYRKIGQPVIIPGSMATASYIMIGTKKAEEISFGSTAHGAGRQYSRTYAKKNFNKKSIEKDLEKKMIILEGSPKGMIEESFESYKNIDKVIETCEALQLGKTIAKLKPIAVIIG